MHIKKVIHHNQVDFIPETQRWLKIYKLNWWWWWQRRRRCFQDKSTRECRARGNILYHSKNHIWETHCQHNPKWRGAWSNVTEVRNEAGLSTTPTPFHSCAWSTSWHNNAKKEMERVQAGKEAQPSLFANDMKLCIRNAKNSTRKPLEMMSPLSNVAGRRISCTNQ